MNALLHALQFLTRLPGLKNVNYQDEAAGAAVTWYPVVGLIIGGLLYSVHMLFDQFLGMPVMPLACIVLIVWVWITGALHLDGLADCADALMGAYDRDRFLAILKDTHVGVAAIVAVVLTLLTKFSSLHTLSSSATALVIILPPVTARITMAWTIVLTPYVRSDGLGTHVKRHTNVSHLAMSSIAVLACVTWLMPLFSCIALIGALAGALAIYAVIVRRIGGATGDVYGAVVESCEVISLLGLVLVV